MRISVHPISEFLIDQIAFQTISCGISISSFVLVIWGFGDGDLGAGGCKDSETRDGCEVVFRARATCFVAVYWTSLLLVWEMIDVRRSMFWMHPRTTTPYTQWMKDLWGHQISFWVRTSHYFLVSVNAEHSGQYVVLGFIATILIIYIPVINDKVFWHAPISWEVSTII